MAAARCRAMAPRRPLSRPRQGNGARAGPRGSPLPHPAERRLVWPPGRPGALPRSPRRWEPRGTAGRAGGGGGGEERHYRGQGTARGSLASRPPLLSSPFPPLRNKINTYFSASAASEFQVTPAEGRGHEPLPAARRAAPGGAGVRRGGGGSSGC